MMHIVLPHRLEQLIACVAEAVSFREWDQRIISIFGEMNMNIDYSGQ